MSEAQQQSTAIMPQTTFADFVGQTAGRPQLWHSIDPASQQGKADLMGAINGECESIADNVGRVIRIRDIVLQRVYLQPQGGKEGELVECIRTVLIDVEHKRYTAVSGGIDSSIVALISLYGIPPWPVGLAVTPKRRKTRRGTQTLILDLASD